MLDSGAKGGKFGRGARETHRLDGEPRRILRRAIEDTDYTGGRADGGGNVGEAIATVRAVGAWIRLHIRM